MTTPQLVLFVGVLPTVTALVGIILSRSDLKEVRGEIVAVRTELKADIKELRKEMMTRFDAMRLIGKSPNP